MSYYQNKRQYWKSKVGGRPTLGGGARRRYYRSQKSGRSFVPRTMGPFAVTESKYFDSFLAATEVAEGTAWTGTELDPGTLNTLVCPSEGSDINNRIGRKIAIYKLQIRGVITTTSLAGQGGGIANPSVRLILFIDQQTNGTQAQGEELMAAPGAASVPLVFNTFQNLANLGRFRVLRDKTYTGRLMAMSTQNTTTQDLAVPDLPFKMTVRFKKPLIMNFNSTNGGTVGDIVDNSFHLIGQKSGTGFASNVAYQCRASYKDH